MVKGADIPNLPLMSVTVVENIWFKAPVRINIPAGAAPPLTKSVPVMTIDGVGIAKVDVGKKTNETGASAQIMSISSKRSFFKLDHLQKLKHQKSKGPPLVRLGRMCHQRTEDPSYLGRRVA
jgi:hypothetical protein